MLEFVVYKVVRKICTCVVIVKLGCMLISAKCNCMIFPLLLSYVMFNQDYCRKNSS
jgi:hypothetical protein